MTWKKKNALKRLGIEQVPFDHNRHKDVHGYAYLNKFAVSPVTPYAGAAGFHEMSHIVLGHTLRAHMEGKPPSDKELFLDELEACATAIICLKTLGAKESGIDAQRDHYLMNRRLWKKHQGDLPSGFKQKVNKAAQLLLTAGSKE